MIENKTKNFLSLSLFALYLIFLASLILSLRATSSICIALIFIAGIVKNKIEQKGFLNSNLKNPFLIFCCMFFLLQFVSLLYTNDTIEGWKAIRLKSALVIVPLALCCSNYIDEAARQKILKWYCLVLFIACLFLIYIAFRNYVVTNNRSVFVYHSLVSSYSGHAIQFSILVFLAVLHLFEIMRRKKIFLNKIFHFFLICFFSTFLFLLSSRLVIIFFLFYLLYYMIKALKNKPGNKSAMIILFTCFITICIFIFITSNPVSKRFREIIKTDFSFIQKEKFNPGDYFNGLQFRLLQWKFVPELLNEKKAWVIGVSPGDAQDYLNQKYISENMYTGTTARGDKGFLGYNTHNQFLEALLQTGLIGLLVFILICASLIQLSWKRKKTELSFITILVLAYSFNESVFETQYSLLIFLFFPLFFYLEKKSDP
jgi:O-antigen ligase